MKNQHHKQNYIAIDAKGQNLGRLASQVASLLMDKDKPNFAPYLEGEKVVEIKNIKDLKISGKKLTSKFYYRHSGYPGKLKKTALGTLFKQSPEEVFKRTVYGMLPKNRLRDRRIKRLIFV